MAKDDRAAPRESPSVPSAALQKLAATLAGTWKLAGGAEGVIKYEWMEGGFFLAQHVDLTAFGKKIRGIEMIGHVHRIAEPPSGEIRSRFYSYLDGLTLDYVYELDGKTLTIWFTNKNSCNRFTGIFSDDGKSFAGAWAWPGGGYEVVGTRIA